MIEVKHLSKKYVDLKAVDDISFTVEKGEILGFLGPNGAGKTTTMRMLTGYIPPTGGTATICGYDIVEDPIQAKKKIGYLPELPPVYMEMQVNKYLKYVAALKDVSKNQINTETDRVIQTCSLGAVANRLIGNLSKGYRQRVGIAQAIVSNPDVLILDEPTSGLDPIQIIEIRNLIKSLAGEHTIILSTHILPEVTMTCNRVVIINEGKIAAIDNHQNLSSHVNVKDRYEVTVKNINDKIFDQIKSVHHVISVEKGQDNNTILVNVEKGHDNRSDIIKSLVFNHYDVLEFKSIHLSLEDVFLKLTKDEEVNA